MSNFALTISEIDHAHFSGAATSVTVPGSHGVLTILAKHMPLITTLKAGNIVVVHNDEQQIFPIERGIMEVTGQKVAILIG